MLLKIHMLIFQNTEHTHPVKSSMMRTCVIPKPDNLIRKLYYTQEAWLVFRFQRSDVCIQQITNDYCSLISLISLFWLQLDWKKKKWVPWQLEPNLLLLIKNSYKYEHLFIDICCKWRFFIIKRNFHSILTKLQTHKSQIFHCIYTQNWK